MGKLEEMLASGRAPGLLIRGSWGAKPLVVGNPSPEAVSGEARDQRARRRFAEAAKLAGETAKQRRNTKRADGEIRHIGRCELSEFCERNKRGELGDDRRTFLKDIGALFPHET